MKKLLLSIAVILILTSCTHKEVIKETTGITDNISFITRNDFALYIYSNLDDNKFRVKKIYNNNLNKAKKYALKNKYMYLYPDDEFKGDRLFSWIDFTMFLGAFYNRLNKSCYKNLPGLKEYSYLKNLFAILLCNGLLNYNIIANFKGNFPIPKSIVEERINALNKIINEN